MSSSMALVGRRAGRLHRAGRRTCPEACDDHRCQRLALDLLGYDEERLSRSAPPARATEQVLHDRDLLLVDEDVASSSSRLHAVGVGHEVGGE